MPKIHILSQTEALKIAAGEVIERPAHVVKELLENALDAGATAITLSVEKAGKSLIQVIDNGCGMSTEDAQRSFLPHATSKITSLHDLEHIASFGFRGEALASIAAISKVTLTTKPQDTDTDALGLAINYSEDKVLDTNQVACPAGTNIQVTDLFFNTPVRKKFLKTDETEWHAIQAIFHAFCISNPSVHFKLLHDKKLILNAPPVQNAKDRAAQIWDHNFAQNLIQLPHDPGINGQQETPRFTISGYISNHHFWRYGRQHMHFFVNKRWVKNSELGKAIMKGFLNVLPPERFPAALVFIQIDQQHLDVNVHPKKEEIKFTKPGVIQTTLSLLVKKTLEAQLTAKLSTASTDNLVPFVCFDPAFAQSFGGQASKAFSSELSREISTNGTKEPATLPPARPETSAKLSPEGASSYNSRSTCAEPSRSIEGYERLLPQPFPKEPGTTFSSVLYDMTPIPPEPPKPVFSQEVFKETQPIPKIIGLLFNTYIILQTDQEVLFIDQHAAHERILYEKYQKNFTPHEGTILLFPEVITLTPTQTKSVCDAQEFFNAQGIQFDALGTRDIAIRSTPPQLKGQVLKEFILEAAHFIEEHDGLEPVLFGKKFSEHLHGQMACKSAVKAGDVLTIEQMNQLIADLQITENRFICVHGRPTTWSVSKTHLEKQFQRK